MEGHVEHFNFRRLKDENLWQLRSGGEPSTIITAANVIYTGCDAYATIRIDRHALQNAVHSWHSNCQTKLRSEFPTYKRDSVRNTVVCVFGSKTLCLFRHFYLLERRKLLAGTAAAQLFSHTLWIRLFERQFKHWTALQEHLGSYQNWMHWYGK